MIGPSVYKVALVAALVAFIQGAPPSSTTSRPVRFPQETEEVLRYGQNLTINFTPHTPHGILSVAFGSDIGSLVYNFVGRRGSDVCVLIFSTGVVASVVDKLGKILAPLEPYIQDGVGVGVKQEDLFALRVVSELLSPSENQSIIMRKYGWTHPSINTTETKFVGFIDDCKDSNDEIKWHSLDTASEVKIVSEEKKLSYEMPGVNSTHLKRCEIELDDEELATPFMFLIGAGPGLSLGEVKKDYPFHPKHESLE